MFGLRHGFDIILGNPPYIQLQENNGKLGKLYQDAGLETFACTGDLYQLFYARAGQLLAPKSLLCLITSNKWLCSGYGEKTRAYLASQSNPKLLLDFGGFPVFENASVDTCILMTQKGHLNTPSQWRD